MDANRRDVARTLADWIDEGRPAVLATVVSSSGSAPRGLGAQLAIADGRTWIGALSGGCTEAAVIAEAERLLTGDDARAGAYIAYAKETMADVGPVCGSTLGVLVERVDAQLVDALAESVGAALVGNRAVLRGRWAWNGGAPEGDDSAPEAGRTWHVRRESISGGEGAVLHALDAQPQGDDVKLPVRIVRRDRELRIEQEIEPAHHLVLGGAGDIARELVLLADRLAWRTTIVDPRRTLLEQTLRRCSPTRTVAAWSDTAWEALGVDQTTACVALAHESHVDEPFLAHALASEAFYVGAVGSRRVQAARRDALTERIGSDAVERLHGPAGLDLGGHAAAEIALAITAEIIAVANARTGGALVASTGAIRAR